MHTPGHTPEHAAPTGASLPPFGASPSGPSPSVPRPGHAPPPRARPTAPLSDADISGIARRVRAAMHRRPPDDRTTWILSAAFELAAADEDRVVAAVARLRDADDADAERAA